MLLSGVTHTEASFIVCHPQVYFCVFVAGSLTALELVKQAECVSQLAQEEGQSPPPQGQDYKHMLPLAFYFFVKTQMREII